MKTYAEIVKEYKKRQHDTVVDTIATGLTYMDEIAVDSGLLEETGILTELTESVSGVLPVVIISADRAAGERRGRGHEGAARAEAGHDRTEGRRVPDGQDRRSHGCGCGGGRCDRILGGDSRHDGRAGAV